MGDDSLLSHAVAALEAVGVAYMLTGSLASIHYGEPRLTVDTDLVVDLTTADLPALAAEFVGDDYHFDAIAAAEAITLRRPLNILHLPTGRRIDVLVRRDREYSRLELARRRRVELLPGLTADIARAEDVILAKLEYHAEGGSAKHLRDIAGILAVSGDTLDHAYLAEWSARLGVAECWHRLRREPEASAG